MDGEKLKWCRIQKRGIRLTEPSDHLARDYIESAEESLEVLQTIPKKSKIWLATIKYYCEYFSVYALLAKLGIRCEIHDCTIELCKFLETGKLIPAEYSKMLEADKTLRLDNQYYLKNIDVEIDFLKLQDFILTIKTKLNTITSKEITETKENLNRILSQRD